MFHLSKPQQSTTSEDDIGTKNNKYLCFVCFVLGSSDRAQKSRRKPRSGKTKWGRDCSGELDVAATYRLRSTLSVSPCPGEQDDLREQEQNETDKKQVGNRRESTTVQLNSSTFCVFRSPPLYYCCCCCCASYVQKLCFLSSWKRLVFFIFVFLCPVQISCEVTGLVLFRFSGLFSTLCFSLSLILLFITHH